MPTKHVFYPNPLPIFIAEPQQQSIGKISGRDAIFSRLVKAGILVAIATAIGGAILAAGSPVRLLANIRALLVDNSLLQRAPDQGGATVPSEAAVQMLLATPEDTPIHNVAGVELAGERPTENSEPSSEALVRQFQAWVAGQDAVALVGPAQSHQDAPPIVLKNMPAQIGETARGSMPRMQKHRRVRRVHSAHAEVQHVQHSRKTGSESRRQGVQVSPQQNARPLRQPLSLLQSSSQRN